MPRYGRVVLGGTFDRLHVGHEALLRTAFRLGDEVAIGLTTAAYLAQHPKPLGRGIAPMTTRRRALARWLHRTFPRRHWSIVPIDDAFGGSVEDGVDALVVSAESRAGGEAVNRERRRRGRRTIPVVVVPLVLADDLEPVSSRRIRAREIDRDGRRIAPVSIGVAAEETATLLAAARAVRRAFPRAQMVPLVEPRHGLGRRASSALAVRARSARELGLGVARTPRGGWEATLASARVQLLPFRLPGPSARALSAQLLRHLRPSPPKPL